MLTALTILLAILFSAISSAVISKYSFRIAAVDVPNERSSHSLPTPRGGGIGIWIALIIVGIFVTGDIYFSAILSIAGLLGLLEDRFTLSSKIRLVSQFVISSFVALLFLGPPSSPLMLSLFLFWLIFITATTNFYNFMDGINGIAGLTGLVGFGLLAFFSYYILNARDVFLMSTALAAGCIGFLPFNFPRARVFMGDVGSILLGFVFASFVVRLSTS
ncbi:MAG TPA: UDP-N-acetylmuramyl pentapeptide phosphotransferase, partial [Nitrospirota bacterium]|nr:UDP-N-acetylmuramyl pentapeptide phosphotransferase [Nitrospirota bacterium]